MLPTWDFSRARVSIVVGVICLASLSALALVPSTHALYSYHGNISIYGNGGFTRNNGVVGGLGTKSDPYLIEGWEIMPYGCGICVTNTTAFFDISNVYVHDGLSSDLGGHGIGLYDVSNALIENSTLLDNKSGITVGTSYGPGSYSNIAIIGNMISPLGIEAIAYAMSSLSNITLSKNHVSNGGSGGISLTDVAKVTITGNILSYTAVYISGSPSQLASYVVTEDNLINGKPLLYRNGCIGTALSGSSYGEIILASCHNAQVARVNMTDSGPAIEFVQVDGGSITNSQFSNVTQSISIVNSANVIVSGNNISSPTKGYPYTIDVSSSSKISIDNNDVSGGGLLFLNSNGSIINGNAMSGGIGIQVSGSNIGIIDNQLWSGGGISLGGFNPARNINITGNVVSGSGVIPPGYYTSPFGPGISVACDCYPIYGALNNVTISGNSLSNDGMGIHLVDATNVTVISNNISDNGNGGVIIANQYVPNAKGPARVYHNNFISNGGGQASGYATWDNGYPSGGNYWSDYTGIDNCSGFYQNICPSPDGIGDTVRPVSGGVADDYPLMKPYGPLDTMKPIWLGEAKLSFSDVSGTQLSLEWPPAVDDTWVQSYRIFQDGTLLATLTGTTTVYLVSGLRPGTAYNFTVEAGDAFANWSTVGLSATELTASNPSTTPPPASGTGSQALGFLQQYGYFVGAAAVACGTLSVFLVIKPRSNRVKQS